MIGGVDHRIAGCRISVDRAALAANWRALVRLSAPARAAGVLKADAYGLGAVEVAKVLLAEGCTRFFVALPHEGVALREAAPEAEIIVLDGLFGPEALPFYEGSALIPALSTPNDIALWEMHCGATGVRHPCAIAVDTGMNRLGLTPAEAIAFAADNSLTSALAPILLMSHLACADQPDHPQNRQQLESFQAVRAAFGEIESSLVNSAGLLLGPDFRFDWARPGIALFGGETSHATPMLPVVTSEARIAQLRQARAGETVSYGATETLARDTLIAVAAIGYADGLPRSLSGSGVLLRGAVAGGGCGFIAGKRVPILGRVTMDLTMFDVTDVGPDLARPGEWIELFGPNIGIDEAAAAAGTVAYELLTGMGRRAERRFVGGEASHG